MAKFDELTNQYPIAKTLRFELKPVGETARQIEKIKDEKDFDSKLAELILIDEDKAKVSKHVKNLIDDFHRDFLNFALDANNISETGREEFCLMFKEMFGVWSGARTLTQTLQENRRNQRGKSDEKAKELKRLNAEFQEQQQKSGEILYRILNDNLKKFIEPDVRSHQAHIASLNEQSDALANQIAETKNASKALNKNKEISGEELKTRKDALADALAKQGQQHKKLREEIKCHESLAKQYPAEISDLCPDTKKLFAFLKIFHKDDESNWADLAEFDGFQGYFVRFNKTRANVYNVKGKSGKFLATSIAHRLFEQNLTSHFKNIQKWEKACGAVKNYGDELRAKQYDFKEELSAIEDGLNFKASDVFCPEYFVTCLSQAGINAYNQILGGKAEEENRKKARGINELLNLTRQQTGRQNKKAFPRLDAFNKQILSAHENSFIEMFQTPAEVIEAIFKFSKIEQRILTWLGKGNPQKGLDSFATMLKDAEDSKSEIYLSVENLRHISVNLTGWWNAIQIWYLDSFPKQTDKVRENSKKILPVAELEGAFSQKSVVGLAESGSAQSTNDKQDFCQQHLKGEYKKKNWTPSNLIFNYLSDKFVTLKQERDDAFRKFNKQFSGRLSPNTEKFTPEQKAAIKRYMDASQDLFRFFKNLHLEEKILGKSTQEANWHDYMKTIKDAYLNETPSITRLYNQTRNYLTKKPFSTEKFKLNFQNPTLANGWDLNKEKDNMAVLLIKENIYYLGIIMHEDSNDLFSKNKDKVIAGLAEKSSEEATDGEVYEKINYKLIPDPVKMLPKVFFSAKNKSFYSPSGELEKNYDIGTHKAGDKFNPKHFRALIDFFKKSIGKHPEWSNSKIFNWDFSSTSSYQGDINAFYHEVEQQSYKIIRSNIRKSDIDRMVEEGKLFLFKIYNKDFSEGKDLNRRGPGKRTPNLHTIYWRALFQGENLSNVVYKLNGSAELFYRRASVKSPFVHKKGNILKHKSFEKQWEEIGLPIGKNQHCKDALPAKKALGVAVVGNAVKYNGATIGRIVESEDRQIVKDKRYSEDKIFFHCSITLNFNQRESRNDFNAMINAHLRQNKDDINIIGIDRGEKNLLYYSVINQQGKILNQGSFNTIIGDFSSTDKVQRREVDYHAKLDKKEKERAGARQKWEEIGSIKELKSGYLSQIVHRLSQLIIKHNAIVVLENLNTGFKRGRFAVEKQVYQKFEKALIDKLNFLVCKDTDNPRQSGHYLNAYQLTDKFSSFEKLGVQSGILFYTNAGYTSKTDPVTGYMRHLYPKYADAKQAQDFFKKFESVVYNGSHFEFAYDLKNFKGMTGSYEKDEMGKFTKWTIHSHVSRSISKQRKLTSEEQKDPQYQKAGGGKWRFPEPVDVTEQLKKLFSDNSITLKKGNDYKGVICATASRQFSNGKFLAKLMAHFCRLLDMRVYGMENGKKTDYIVSPVFPFYDSRKVLSGCQDSAHAASLPVDSDANGAYNIARKGILILEKIAQSDESEKINLSINKTDWQNYAQSPAVVENQKKKYK